MPDIFIPKKNSAIISEFNVASAILVLAGYCLYPNDPDKAKETRQVLNVALLHKFKYDFMEKCSELHDPTKQVEFWGELNELGKKFSFEVDPNLPEKMTAFQYATNFISKLVEFANSSLELPEDIERFLLDKPTPSAIQKEWRSKYKDLVTAILVVIKLMQMEQHTPNVRGGVSLKKAFELLCCEGSECPLKNVTQIRKAWDAYKKSIHLSIGVLLSGYFSFKTEIFKDTRDKDGNKFIHVCLSPAALGVALILSKSFQDWLLNFKLSVHTSSFTAKRLIKPEQLWLVPSAINNMIDIKRIMAALPPLREQEIVCLNQKRS